MAEQLVNALVSPSATLATASITAGVTTSFDVVWNEPAPPTTGTYSLLFKGASDDGSDDSIFRVSTMSDTDTISNGSWEKVGAQSTFTSGCEVDLDHSAASVDKYSIPRAGGTAQGYVDFDNPAASGVMIDGGATLQMDSNGLNLPAGTQVTPYGFNEGVTGGSNSFGAAGSPTYFSAHTQLVALGMSNPLDPTPSMGTVDQIVDPTMGSIFRPNPGGGGHFVYFNNDATFAYWFFFVRNTGGVAVRLAADPLSSGAFEGVGYFDLAGGASCAFFCDGYTYYRIL